MQTPKAASLSLDIEDQAVANLRVLGSFFGVVIIASIFFWKAPEAIDKVQIFEMPEEEAQWAAYIALVALYVRLWMGLNFADEDSSFQNALAELEEKERCRRSKKGSLILAALYVLMFMYLFSLTLPAPVGLVILCRRRILKKSHTANYTVQLHNWQFGRKRGVTRNGKRRTGRRLKRPPWVDEQYRSNRVILAGDFLFLLFVVFGVVLEMFARHGLDATYEWVMGEGKFYLQRDLTLVFSAVIVGIFVWEFFAHYVGTMWNGGKNIWRYWCCSCKDRDIRMKQGRCVNVLYRGVQCVIEHCDHGKLPNWAYEEIAKVSQIGENERGIEADCVLKSHSHAKNFAVVGRRQCKILLLRIDVDAAPELISVACEDIIENEETLDDWEVLSKPVAESMWQVYLERLDDTE